MIPPYMPVFCFLVHQTTDMTMTYIPLSLGSLLTSTSTLSNNLLSVLTAAWILLNALFLDITFK